MISIVLPVYNAEQYIEKCITSIQKQTYKDWELVVIDNGSVDRSYRICREYAREDSRIRVFHQYQNKGVSAARNLGLERISGEFLTFIDVDDWILPNYLEQMFETQKKYDADMIVCGYERVEEKDRETEIHGEEKKEYSHRIYGLEEYFREYMLEGNTHCWGILFRTGKLEGICFPTNLTIGEDLLYLIHAAMKMEKIVISEYRGYRYYINQKGAMLKKFTHSYMDQLTCWQQAKKEVVCLFPQLQQRLESILVVSSLLVVGKIAELSREEQETYKEELEKCIHVVKQYGTQPEVRRYLPKGYRIKVFIFYTAPSLYLKLYGAKKSMKKIAE